MSIGGQKRAPQERLNNFEQLELLFELASVVARAGEPREIYRAAAKSLVLAVGPDRAAVLIIGRDRMLRFEESVGLSDGYRADMESLMGRNGEANESRQFVIADVLQDSSVAAYQQIFAKEGIRAVALVPLIGKVGLIGKFALYYNTPHFFQPDELRLAQTIAIHVASAAEQHLAATGLRESEERFRAIFFQAAVGIAQTSVQGEWLLLNDRLCQILGYTQAELRGKTFLDITHPDDREANIIARRQLLAGEISSWSMEKRYIHKSGATVWASVYASLVRDQHHQPQYFISVIDDITARIDAERDLGESERRLRLALSAGLGVWDYDLSSHKPQLSPHYLKFYGHVPPTHAEWFKLVHPDDRERVIARVRESIKRAGEWDAEFRLLCPDGSVRWLLSKGTVLLGDQGRPDRMMGVSLDVTERKRTEEALRVSQQRLELAQEAGGVAVWDWDVTTGQTHCSSGYGPLYGLPTGEFAPPPEQWFELIHPEDRANVRDELNRALERSDYFSVEFRVVLPDQTIRWLLGKGQVFRDQHGNPIRAIGVNMDISERKRAEAALRESEERFRIMADTAPVMICSSGPDKLATFFNKVWLNFTGRTMDQELGYGWTNGVHPDDLDGCLASYSASFEARQDCHIEYRLRRADGEYRRVVCNGTPLFESDGIFSGYIASCIDITDAKRMQEEAMVRQKLESLGVLASGIAHDFNNLIGGILVSSELALSGRGDGSLIHDDLQRIRTAAIHGGEIVRQLMIYSGKESSAFEPVDLSLVIEEMVHLLKVSISKHAALKIEPGENVRAIQANPTQVRQVVMNLVVNASEAVGDRGGIIRIRTSPVRVVKNSNLDLPNLPEGEYVRMEISDTGPGMTSDVQAKIFDPFFTTKFPGHGRGLGLAVTQGIIRSHGGAIHVDSSSQGTVFRVWLPCAGKRALEAGHSLSPNVTERVASQGSILVVEDEDLLRLAVTKALSRSGFSVIEAGDGSAAMKTLRDHRDDVNLILLDVTLPGMSSREIFEEAKRIRPELKVILTSAYGWEAVSASFAGLRIERFIRKPFQLVELVAVLQDALSD